MKKFEIDPLKNYAELYCEARVENEKLKSENRDLKTDLDWYKRQFFGQKSEKIELDPEAAQTMLNLFDEPIEIPALENSDTGEISTDSIPKTKESSKKGRRVIPDSLPFEEVLILPNESELICSCCGKPMKEIGREESKSLEYVPAHFKVIKRVRPKFGCSCGEGGIIIAETPSRPIEKSIAESSLLSHVAVSKYVDHLPLYRQSQIFDRYDIAIPRSTIDSWLGQMSELLTPLHERMRTVMLQSEYLQMDETTIKVQKDPGVAKSKKRCHLGYFLANYRWKSSCF